MTRSDIAAIAQGLTGAQKRACRALTGAWQFGGRATFSVMGAASLRYFRPSLVERRYDGATGRPFYRLTPLGILVRDFLREVG